MRIRAEISEHDSVHRYTVDVGVDVFSGRANFTGSNEMVPGSDYFAMGFRIKFQGFIAFG